MSNIITTQNNDKFRGVWLPNTFYRQDDMVFDGTSLWIALTDFTSGATFDAVNWFCPDCGVIDLPTLDQSSNKNGLINVLPNGYTAEYLAGGSSSYIMGNKVVDSGYKYFEVDVSGVSGSLRVGVTSVTTPEIDSHSLSNSLEYQRGHYYNENTFSLVLSPWTTLYPPDILRVWYRPGKIWFGSRIYDAIPPGYTDIIVGDPVLNTGGQTLLSTNPMKLYLMIVYNSNVSVFAKSSNIVCDPLGATPWDE